VEHWKAGGHNAPPRRKVETESGFGPLDEVNFEKMKAVGLPFWLAGGRSTPDSVKEAFALGAEGVQVGTLFALSNDSGLLPKYREQMLDAARKGTLKSKNRSQSFSYWFSF
jgi:NAD(P)H-dependent flavin oxidoreductase YrpB (nitropropane dioxygenase family)